MTETMIFEDPLNVRGRTNKIKEMIRDKYSTKYKSIIIVAHYNIINFMMCREFDENNEPNDHSGVGNCQIVHETLESMLKYKWSYVKLILN
jgi:broad specificity phosphatase PhoE